MASIYTLDGDEVCSGLQGCNTCDHAIKVAHRTADRLGVDVVLDDDDGTWIVHPNSRGTRKPATPVIS